jgi:phosphate transport system substrate-binding protein
MRKANLWKWCAASAVLVVAGCGGGAGTQGGATNTADAGGAGGSGGTGGSGAPSNLTGQIRGDGSSTVFPITEAVAEEFGQQNPNVKVTVGISGTGGGFKKFIAGDTVLQNASRPIKAEEAEKMKAAGREFIEIPIAYDGLSVVVNPKNTWATCLTTAELKKIWDRGSKVNNWSQVRAGFPNRPIKLFGAGTDSGTFDYFTDEINGEEGRSRSDYTASEDDNTLVQGVARDVNALGYFGHAYAEENKAQLKIVGVNPGDGCVVPDSENIISNKYKPLSRPLFLYVERKAADRPEIQAFVNFYLENVPELAQSVGYVPLPNELYETMKKRFANRTTGSVYANKVPEGATLQTLYGGNGGASGTGGTGDAAS